MKPTKEILNFCNEFTFYDHYKIDWVIELNYVHDYIINVLSESDFKHEDNRIKKLGIIDDISLKVINGDVENIGHDISNQRVAILQMLCLEKL